MGETSPPSDPPPHTLPLPQSMAAIEMPLGPFLTIVVQTHSPADGGVGNDTVVGGALWQNAESEPLPCTAAKLREAQCWESHNKKKLTLQANTCQCITGPAQPAPHETEGIESPSPPTQLPYSISLLNSPAPPPPCCRHHHRHRRRSGFYPLLLEALRWIYVN
jgi:hypothetical protein